MRKPLQLEGKMPYINIGQYMWAERRRWDNLLKNIVSMRDEAFSEYGVRYRTKTYAKNRKKYLLR